MSITEIYNQTVQDLSPTEQRQLATLILSRVSPVSDMAAVEDAARPVPVAAETTKKAMEFYDIHLRSVVEPEQNGKYIAIHPETQEYAVERGPGRAFRVMRARRPKGPIVLHHIGPADAQLKSRLRGNVPVE